MDTKVLNQQSQHWEKNFSNKPEMFGIEPSLPSKKALKLFQENKINEVVEIGAGLGRDTIFFANNSIQITAQVSTFHILTKSILGGVQMMVILTLSTVNPIGMTQQSILCMVKLILMKVRATSSSVSYNHSYFNCFWRIPAVSHCDLLAHALI